MRIAKVTITSIPSREHLVPMMGLRFAVGLLGVVLVVPAFAAQFPVQARFSLGVTSADPSNLNQEMNAQGIKEFKSIPKYGVEATYALAGMLDVGFRYEKRYFSNLEVNPTPNADYQAALDQDAVLFIARIPFIKSSIFRMDIFGGVGGSNTTFKIKASTQDGEIARRESGDWFASMYSSYGASAGVGYKGVYFFVEGGMESNKVDTFKRTGNVNTNVQTIDLSGGYVSAGLIIDGMTATSK